MRDTAYLRGSKLPLVLLACLPDGEEVPLIAGRGPEIIVALHGPACAACVGYAQRLAEGPRLADWGGRLILVVPGSPAGASALASSLPGSMRVLADPRGSLARWGPAVMVADEWGEVFFAASITDRHDLPSPEELADWAKYVAIQCEECEMPEGGWKAL